MTSSMTGGLQERPAPQSRYLMKAHVKQALTMHRCWQVLDGGVAECRLKFKRNDSIPLGLQMISSYDVPNLRCLPVVVANLEEAPALIDVKLDSQSYLYQVLAPCLLPQKPRHWSDQHTGRPTHQGHACGSLPWSIRKQHACSTSSGSGTMALRRESEAL